MKATITSEALKNVIIPFVALIGANKLGAQVVGHFPITDLRKGTANNRTLAYEKFFNETTKTWNVSKVTRFKNVTFLRDYTHSVENRSDNPLPYVVEAPKGRKWVEGCEGVILVSTSDPTKLYLRMCENKNTIRETTYYVNNVLATEEEVAIIKEFSPKRDYVCKKQIDYGVSEEAQVIVKDLTLTNIMSIKFGDKVLNLQ